MLMMLSREGFAEAGREERCGWEERSCESRDVGRGDSVEM